MLSAILIGILGSGVAFLPHLLYYYFPEFPWFSVGWIPLIVGVSLIFDKKSRYEGLSDFFLYIHSFASHLGSQFKTQLRIKSVISFLFSCFTGIVGPEGAAIEMAQALNLKLRSPTLRWFEHKRRSDVAICMSAGVAATFGAPFAGALFPLEIGVGGRSIFAVMSALTSFLFTFFLHRWIPVQNADLKAILVDFKLGKNVPWLMIGMTGVICGVFSVFLIRFTQFTQISLKKLTGHWGVLSTLIGAIILIAVFVLISPYRTSPANLLGQVLWQKWTETEVLYLYFTHTLSFVILLTCFGTAGILWPLLLLGGFLGYSAGHLIPIGPFSSSAIVGFSGSAAFCGGVLGIPVTATLIIFEMTQNPQVLLPCLVCAFIAHQCRKGLKTLPFIDFQLENRGARLLDGRSFSVLDSILVKDAMITDFETVYEKQIVTEIKEVLNQSPYPFLVVVNAAGDFTGLVTDEMIQEALERDSLLRVLEVKDLLYQWRDFHVVNELDKLSSVVQSLNEVPCLPVLNSENRVIGLLFSYTVRLAYDREAAKRSLSFLRDANSGIM